MKKLLIVAIAILCLVPAGGAFAQGDVPVKGDAESDALSVVQQFVESHDNSLLADNVQFVDEARLEATEGRDDVLSTTSSFYGQESDGWQVIPTQYVVADDTVVLEFHLSVSEDAADDSLAAYAGATAPMVDVYTVTDGQITSIRRYYHLGALENSIGMTGAPGLGSAAVPGAEPMNVGDMTGDFNAWVGQTVTVNGTVSQVLNERAIEIVSGGDLLSDVDKALVLSSPDGPSFADFDEDALVQVTGTVRAYDQAALQDEVGFGLPEDLFGSYADNAVIVAVEAVERAE
ncbi:nuclear transport factor 2 family protein [Aggregatilinea lenta]|uniref:nuclear transport factor 2 family protein n=1 Tax=Aggregatilinea lenta TaxID=913108 RepID=UPI000E5A361D|nr:nuclear transport factor 2 family protein [Aggregatilinea lenta]